MKKTLASLITLAALSAGAQAATVSANLSITGSGTSSGSNYSVTGTAILSGGLTGTGTASSTFSATALATLTIPLTVTFPAGTMTGTFVLKDAGLVAAILTGASSATGSGTFNVTGGTYGATGSFTLTGGGNGTGTTTAGQGSFTISGPGTLTTGTGGGGGGGGGTTSTTPTVSAILDAGSYTSGIAAGSIFVVKGANLSASGFTQNNGYPLQTTLGGVKVTFTPVSGGAGTDCYMIYLYNQSGVNQLAAFLPSSVAAGNYNVTITNGSQVSAVFAAQVLARKPGFITRDSTGSGLAVVQNYVTATKIDIDGYTTGVVNGVSISPLHPGETFVAYGTGFGAVPGATAASEASASQGHNFMTDPGVNIFAIIGGMNVTPLYAGRTPGSSGLDQLNVVLPGNTPTGCAVTFQLSINGVLTPATYLAIAPDTTSTACVQQGFTTAQLQALDAGGSVTSGGFSLLQFAESINLGGSIGTIGGKYDQFGGSFTTYNGYELSAVTSSGSATYSQQGSCTVSTITGSSTTTAGGVATYLDAGTLSLTGPSGSNLSGNLTNTNGAYSLNLGFEGTGFPAGFPSTTATLVAGTYTLKGNGGKDVGAFTATVNLGAPLNVTGGLTTSITRSSDLTVNFTGGNSSDTVILSGSSATGSGSTQVTTSFVCITTAGTGKVVVPTGILVQLPATTAGSLAIYSGPTANFTAPLTAGGTVSGTLSGLVGAANTSETYK